MNILDNIEMLYCLNDTGLDKVYRLVSDVLQDEQYIDKTLGQLEEERVKVRVQLQEMREQNKKEEQEKIIEEQVKIRKHFSSELLMIKKNPAPWGQNVKLLNAISKLDIDPEFKVWDIFTWGYIQGKRVERAKRKKVQP